MRKLIPGGIIFVTLTGCSVDLNATASSAVQSVFNSLFGVLVSGFVNSLVPVAG